MMKAPLPSPNSFHFKIVCTRCGKPLTDPPCGEKHADGKPQMFPGLGDDEPSLKELQEAQRAAERQREAEAALETAKAAVRDEARALEARSADMARIEEERATVHEEAMSRVEQLEARLKAQLAELEAKK